LQHGLDNADRPCASSLLAEPQVRAGVATGGVQRPDQQWRQVGGDDGHRVDPDSEFAVKGPFLTVTAGDSAGQQCQAAEVMLGEGWPKASRPARAAA
jgi:putative ABC transport system permease protein